MHKNKTKNVLAVKCSFSQTGLDQKKSHASVPFRTSVTQLQ
jgi:hypothetical protein